MASTAPWLGERKPGSWWYLRPGYACGHARSRAGCRPLAPAAQPQRSVEEPTQSAPSKPDDALSWVSRQSSSDQYRPSFTCLLSCLSFGESSIQGAMNKQLWIFKSGGRLYKLDGFSRTLEGEPDLHQEDSPTSRGKLDALLLRSLLRRVHVAKSSLRVPLQFNQTDSHTLPVPLSLRCCRAWAVLLPALNPVPLFWGANFCLLKFRQEARGLGTC